MWASLAPASAGTYTFTCHGKGAAPSGPITLVFDGQERGALTVSGAFGAWTLPALKMEREGEVDGKTVKAMGIRANGPARAQMPDKGAFDACIAAKKDPNEPDPILEIMSCTSQTPDGPAPVSIDAAVEIAIIDPPNAMVTITRTFAEKSPATGDVIALQTVPPLDCVMAATP